MKLEDWRNEIDTIDNQIINLINQRARIVKKIGILKAKAGLSIIDNEREEEVLRIACSKNQDVMSDDSICRIYKIILSESRQIQSKVLTNINEKGVNIY